MNENKVKRRFGDRYEGRRIRGYNPMDRVAWYIMPRRNGATNLLAYSVDVASMEDYIRQKRAEGLDSFGITHVLLAAYVRTVSQRPALNRFLSGQKLYARNEIWVNMDVKKEMRTGSPDTVIKAVFPKDATARQVYEVLNSTIKAAKEEDSSFDGTARALNYIPYTFTTDERICDGFYYASAFKLLRGYLKDPWQLDVPPESVKEDIR